MNDNTKKGVWDMVKCWLYIAGICATVLVSSYTFGSQTQQLKNDVNTNTEYRLNHGDVTDKIYAKLESIDRALNELKTQNATDHAEIKNDIIWLKKSAGLASLVEFLPESQ